MFSNLFLPFCSIEDLILYKLFANRPKDIADLYDIAFKYKNNLDRNYLAKMLDDFTKLGRDDMKENFS